MNNLLKRRFGSKAGSGCAMCKPQKHHGADQRTVRDKKADFAMLAQLDDLGLDLRIQRSVAQQ